MYCLPHAAVAAGSKTIGLSDFVEKTLVLVPPNSCLEASAANGVDGCPSPHRTLRQMESLSPSHATNTLQIHRETRKQPHKCPERGNVALRLGLYKMTSWPPRGSFILGIKMERSVVLQPQKGIGQSAPSSRSRTFAPAPSASIA